MEEAQNIIVEKKIIKTKEGKLPKEFDPANLTNLFVDQFVTWDEVHRKVIPGSDYVYVRNQYKDHIMKFQRKNNGKFDVLNRTYSREKVTLTKCKYTDEVLLCLGVFLMRLPSLMVFNNLDKSECAKRFVYSRDKLISMTDFDNKFQNNIARLKRLKGGHTSGWVKVPVAT